MRSLFVGMIMLSASMAVVDTAQAQIQRPPGYGSMQAPIGHRSWPIHNGFNHQPTQDELRALHQQDVTRDQAQDTDRLYDQLMSTSNQILVQRPARVP
jgi:hypothetical protein